MANFLDCPNGPQDFFMCQYEHEQCAMLLDVEDKCQRDIHKSAVEKLHHAHF